MPGYNRVPNPNYTIIVQAMNIYFNELRLICINPLLIGQFKLMSQVNFAVNSLQLLFLFCMGMSNRTYIHILCTLMY